MKTARLFHIRSDQFFQLRADVLGILILAAGSIFADQSAQAAGCKKWDNSASWGKAWICVDYKYQPNYAGGQVAYHVFGQVMDTKQDGSCVTLFAQQGKEIFSGKIWTKWAPAACTLNRAVNFSFTMRASEWPFCGARLVRGTKSNWTNFRTVWRNVYFGCDAW